MNRICEGKDVESEETLEMSVVVMFKELMTLGWNIRVGHGLMIRLERRTESYMKTES